MVSLLVISASGALNLTSILFFFSSKTESINTFVIFLPEQHSAAAYDVVLLVQQFHCSLDQVSQLGLITQCRLKH